jgi:hypothetical protein
MGIEKCLNAKVEAGKLTRELAEEALRLVKGLERDYARTVNRTAAEARAAADAAKELARQAAVQKRQTALHILATDRALREAKSHKRGVFAGAAALFARDIWGVSGFPSIEGRMKAVRSDLMRRWGVGLEAFRTRALGVKQDIPGLKNMVRALYGETVDDNVAAAAAKAYTDATDSGVVRFNAAGGDLALKKDWRLPQVWVRKRLMGKATEFRDYMWAARRDGRLKVIDWETKLPVDDAKFEDMLTRTYEKVTTNGLSELTPGARGGTKLANSRLDPRAFEWASSDAWFEFNNRWGVGDDGIYGLLTGHIEGMARDIAHLEILGPNPDLVARVLIDTARKDGVAPTKVHQLQAIYDHVTGRANAPVSEMLANVSGGLRAWLSASQLGSAVLSATTDFSSLRAAASWNGLSSTKLSATYLKLLNPASSKDRMIAARAGLIAETWLHRAQGAARNSVDEHVSGVAGMAAEAVMRGSGLAAHTDAGKMAFGLEYLGLLADLSHAELGALPPELRRSFAAYGISAADWNIIRKTGVGDIDGLRIVWPENLAGQGKAEQEAASKLMGMILTEADMAIPTPGVRERALLLSQSRRGTVGGEFRRFTLQYKSFPVTMMSTHLMRGISHWGQGGGLYLAKLGVDLTVMGALAIQLKQLANGKDPRDMTEAKFWGASFIQGGGAGIVGDFLYAGLNRAQAGFYMTTIGGPAAKLLDDTVSLTGWNIQGAITGERTNFGREMVKFLRNNTPGSSLWYSRLAMDRLIWDQLQSALDPEYRRAFKRTEDRARKDYGQSYWWRPGEAAPQRAPDLAAVAPVR